MKNENKKKLKRITYYVAIIGLYLIISYLKNKYGDEEIEPETVAEYINDTDLEVQFIDVGQADCILIRDNDEAMLIDAGNNEDGEKLVKYFKELGIKEFKYVVGTHAHEDHIGGMDDIIDNFDIDTFYMPDAITTTKTFEDVLDSLEKKNYSLDIPKEDDEFKVGEALINVIYVGEESKNLNETSIVLRLDYDEISYLFTGDTTTKMEKLFLDKNIDVDVLKVAHHGSKTSSSKKFIEACSPEYGIIEVGNDNIYNLPTEAIIDRLKKYNIEIHRTDEDGTIITETNGKVLTLRKVKTDTDGN